MRYRTTVTNKEDNSVGYLDYVWVDSKLISISFTSDELNQTVKYLYNDFDEPVGFVSTREDGSVDTYYYLKNAQGDITNIVSAAGKKMVTFTYDVFGKRTVEYQANNSTTPGQIELLTQMKADLLNPFAYRGYCYDYDMGMYYLQSRYYDPNTGRFINADDTNYLNATGTVLGCNLFAYCENDPVNNIDPEGNWIIRTTVLAFSIDCVITLLGPSFKYGFDLVGAGLRYWAKKKGVKFFADKLLFEVVPKFKGLFSRFFTTIRTVIYRVTGSFLSNTTNNFFIHMTRALTRYYNAGKYYTIYQYIATFLSTGSLIAAFMAWTSTGNWLSSYIYF